MESLKKLPKDLHQNSHRNLFILMVIDYLLTYVEINMLGFIQEGNPLLIWMFEIPFIPSFLIRIFYCSLIVYLYEIVKKAE